MPKIYVKKAFTLQHEGEKHEFAVGNHDVPAAISAHWFVKAHTGDEPTGSDVEPSDLADQRAALDSAAQLLEARAQQLQELQEELAGREKAVAEREDAADQRDVSLLAREKAVTEREQAAEKAAADAAKATKAK